MTMLTPKECATVLAKIYRENGGSYRIEREDLKNITGRPVVHQTIIEDVADWLVDNGLILIDRDGFYAVLRHDYFDVLDKVGADTLTRNARPVEFAAPGTV